MLLATGPSFEFAKFIQVFCWIILPVSLLAIILTVFFHYWKKKTGNNKTTVEEEEFLNASPEQVGYTRGDGEYISFDHSALISEYKRRLACNHAKYAALRQDFEKLEFKYTDLVATSSTTITHKKSTGMETNHEQSLRDELTVLSAAYKAEKEELQLQLGQMNQSFSDLEAENKSLQDQLKIHTVSEDERSNLIHQWQEENASLKEQIAGQEYLRDVVEEKREQIVFLQNQLEQRIKLNHQLDQQRLRAIAGMEEEKKRFAEVLHHSDGLKNEILQKQEEIDRLQMMLCGKEEQLTEKQNLVSSKLDHITWLENQLHQSKEHNHHLTGSLTETHNTITNLQEQLNREQTRNSQIEQKILTSQQAIQKLYKEFSLLMNKDGEQSPVIVLRPDYSKKETEEIAVVQ
jgi:chromosome segregation ATPase